MVHGVMKDNSQESFDMPFQSETLYAAIDLGTNSCRLLIAKMGPKGLEIIDSFSRVVRLGEGLTSKGVLSDASIRRTIDALRICAEKISKYDSVVLRCVATEACRQAKNSDEFIARVKDDVGIDIEIISAREEALYSLIGCSPLLNADADFNIVFDIGGGSTEILWVERDEDRGHLKFIDSISIPVGVVSLSESMPQGTRFNRKQYNNNGLILQLIEGLDGFAKTHGVHDLIAQGRVSMLGCSGTVTTLSALHQNLSRYQRHKIDGYWLTRKAIHTVAAELSVMSTEERALHPCIGRGRADLVIFGSMILEVLVRVFPVDAIRVADRGVREGVLIKLIDEDMPDLLLNKFVQH